VAFLKPGDGIYCTLCNRKMYLTVPPPESLTDPWHGSLDARVQARWPKQRDVKS
jgi:hypothetical protein